MFPRKLALTFLLVALVTVSCGAPNSFVKVMQPTWTSLELRENLAYEQAWSEVTSLLAKKFELEMISKDGGYLRTSWIHTWWLDGEITEDYRVRAVIKFSPGHDRVDVKTDAQYKDGGEWIVGTDTRLLNSVKTDIMGVVGAWPSQPIYRSDPIAAGGS